MTGWLQQRALQCFRERVAHYYPLLEVAEPEVRLSNARSRWGSCHVNGRIRLNWRGLTGGTEVWKEVTTFFEGLGAAAVDA